MEHQDLVENQHIYITSDEERYVFQAIRKSGYKTIDKEYKIILTTDQDLIKDNIQSIDDEFLEWFVKNPRCEYVVLGFMSNITSKGSVRHYKIIIPKK
jgi:hypothetical protein